MNTPGVPSVNLLTLSGFKKPIKKSFLVLSILTTTFSASLLFSGCFSSLENKQTENTSDDSTSNIQTSVSAVNLLVQKSEIQSFDFDKPSIAPGENVSAAIQVAITVNRDALLNQEFLYGADLQYSSAYTEQLDLFQQSMAIGHIPARFRIVGNELQLVADNKRLYASAVNHPEQLLSRYKILGHSEAKAATQTSPAKPATLTLSGANSGLALSEIFAGATVGSPQGTFTNPEAGKPPRDLWIRSFDYISEGNYLLQQTSVVMADGTIAEFMESVFPRSTLNPGVNFETFAMDPRDPVGAQEGPVARYRMLAGERNFEGEKEVSYAQHFDISPSADGSEGTIDYYVTRNIPEEFLEPVRLGVEGWNRYFVQMDGVNRKVMQFKGRLPEGIYLGDPRFNVINWDSRQVAGAAYESQASDPATGRQSHSLIYMPAAWLFIGNKYWENGKYSDPIPESVSSKSLTHLGGALRAARLACLRNTKEIAGVLESGRLSDAEISIFGIQLLKQTLFHEIGHSIGLGHNFKGSLNYVHGQPDSIFATSIMDYNDFEVERQAFDEIHSWNGPLLEYDRQIVSVLYNHSKDLRDSDPVLPACADEEADNEFGGVDPLCIRYDIENDPTLSVNTAYAKVSQKTLEGDITLAQALERVGNSIINKEAIDAIKTDEDLARLFSKMAQALTGSMRFYFVGAKTSLAQVVSTNTKSLLMFEPEILPEDYKEDEMRARAFNGVEIAANLTTLPPVITQTLGEVSMKSIIAVSASPLFKNLKRDEMVARFIGIRAAMDNVGPAFEQDLVQGLPKLRAFTLASLHRHAEVPFYLGELGKDHVDYESAIIGMLSKAILDKDRSVPERIYSSVSLMSFKGRITSGDRAIKTTRDFITRERNKAQTNEEREALEMILTVMKHT
jgi:hypothetical protein